MILEVLATSIRQAKGLKVIHVGREKIKLCLSANNMILYEEHLKGIYKLTARTNKHVQQGHKMQDQHTEINCFSIY